MISFNGNKKKYFITPFWNGVVGFLIFLTVLLAVELFSNYVGNQTRFEFGTEDILLSLIGFVLFFLIKFLENMK